MKKSYIHFGIVMLLVVLVIGCNAQPCGQSFIVESDFGNTLGEYDTMCVGGCQRYWIVNASCPEFNSIGFHWVFYGRSRIDTLIGDTIYRCFPDTGVFLFDVYASNFNTDSDFALNARNIILPCPPEASFTTTSQTICTHQSVTFTDRSIRLPDNWQWTFEGGTPQSFSGRQPPPILYTDTGAFSVRLEVRNQYGTDDLLETNYIHVLPGPHPVNAQNVFQIDEGDEVTLTACARGSIYQWQPPNDVLLQQDTFVTVQPDNTQNYTCIVATENGCLHTCDYMVNVKAGLLLPTAFSPNRDMVNDVFRILNTNIELIRFSVYNRWGGKIFETKDIDTGWDGTYQGIAQPIGTYIWFVDYKITKTQKQKSARGNVTLIR